MESLRNLFEDGILTDVNIRIGGRHIPAHRAILAARWHRFYARFLADPTVDTVDIDAVGDINPETFEKLLKCIYSDQIPHSIIQDPDCRELARKLELDWFVEASERPPTKKCVDCYSARSSLDWKNFQEISDFTKKTLRYRSFLYTTKLSRDKFIRPTFSFEDNFVTEFLWKKGELIKATWKISLKSAGDGAVLRLISLEHSTTVKTRCRFSIANIEGRVEYEVNKFITFDLNSESPPLLESSFVDKELAANKEHINRIRFDGQIITVNFEIGVKIDDVTDYHLTSNLSEDLGSLLEEGRLSDVTLLAGGCRFPVHRSILAARSTVFRAMFLSNMREKLAPEIAIEDVEPEVMTELLRYIHTDHITTPVKTGSSLLVASDKFGSQNLFDRCQKSMEITGES